MYDLERRHYDRRRTHWATSPSWKHVCSVPMVQTRFDFGEPDVVVAEVILRESAATKIQRIRELCLRLGLVEEKPD